MLPARHGDCLWVEYGRGRDVHRILVDGGPVSTFEFIDKRLQQLPPGDRAFELIVLTHVDADHVEGVVRLFAEHPLPFTVDHVWFNGWRQMKKAHGLLGPLQGEFFSALLAERVPQAWDCDAEPWVVPSVGKLPTQTLEGGMKLTLLSPRPAELRRMASAWKAAMQKDGIVPGNLAAAWKALAQTRKFLPKKGLLGSAPDLDSLLKKQIPTDQAVPNGSSIAFLAEYEGKSALFLADAHPDVISSSIERLRRERGVEKLRVGVVKVAHHGSKHNTNNTELVQLDSPSYLISTNGDQFKHPDKECIARILRVGRAQRLYFNYRTRFTEPWLKKGPQKKYCYSAIVRAPDDLTMGIAL